MTGRKGRMIKKGDGEVVYEKRNANGISMTMQVRQKLIKKRAGGEGGGGGFLDFCRGWRGSSYEKRNANEISVTIPGVDGHMVVVKT